MHFKQPNERNQKPISEFVYVAIEFANLKMRRDVFQRTRESERLRISNSKSNFLAMQFKW